MTRNATSLPPSTDEEKEIFKKVSALTDRFIEDGMYPNNTREEIMLIALGYMRGMIDMLEASGYELVSLDVIDGSVQA